MVLPTTKQEDTTMEKITNLAALAAKIAELPGVQSARAWTRVPGKERIYIDLVSYNGGKHWNGGRGNTIVVHIDGRIEVGDQWAGATTYRRHQEMGTLDAIEAIVNSEK